MPDHDDCTAVPFDASRCPACGNEAGNERLEPAEGADRSVLPPPRERAVCGECGCTARPVTFTREYREERMTDEQRERTRQARSEWTTRAAENRR